MQFTIEREIILRALARVQGIVEKRNTIPILSNILIEADENSILLTATDLEVGMQASYQANVKKSGRVTVAAKKLYEIIKELPEGDVAFQAKENCWIEIRCGKAVFNLVGLAADEYPHFPNREDCKFFTLPSSEVKSLLERTSYSMSHDESKYNLNGIYFQSLEENGKKLLRLVATDGHRLALVQRSLETDISPNFNEGVILPKKGVFELRKIAEDGDSDMAIGLADNNAIVVKDNTVVVMRLVDGDFPDYQRVIPQSSNLRAIIPRELFMHALRRIAIFSSEKSRGVKLTLSTNQLVISSSNPDLGDAREDLEMDYGGQEIEAGFNARYMLDILQSQDIEEIVFQVKDNMSPGLITAPDNEDFLAVIMPMRL